MTIKQLRNILNKISSEHDEAPVLYLGKAVHSIKLLDIDIATTGPYHRYDPKHKMQRIKTLYIK